MFHLQIRKNHVIVVETEMVTSGSVNVYDVQYEFNEAWEGLDRIAVFRAGTVMIQVQLPPENLVTIPWEVMVEPNLVLYMGVYGRNCETGDVVLPTVWAAVGTIQLGVVTTLGGRYMPCEAIVALRYQIAAFQERLRWAWETYPDADTVNLKIMQSLGNLDLIIRTRLNLWGYVSRAEARELIRINIPDVRLVWEMIDKVVGPNLGLTMVEFLAEFKVKFDVDKYIRDEFYRLGYVHKLQMPGILDENIPTEADVWTSIDNVVGPNRGITQEEFETAMASFDVEAHIRNELARYAYVKRSNMSAILATEIPDDMAIDGMIVGTVGPSLSISEDELAAAVAEANDRANANISDTLNTYMSTTAADALVKETADNLPPPVTADDVKSLLAKVIG